MKTAVSLFSGAGGMDIGVIRAGYSIEFANDIDADACRTYEHNLGDHIVCGDLSRQLGRLRAFRDVDLIFGGPPCQGFSVAGKMDPLDERSQLLFTFFKAVNLVQPKAFICENVKALGSSERWSLHREKIDRATRDSYSVGTIILKASDFGVSQNRERVFFIGVKRDVIDSSKLELEVALLKRLDAYRSPPPVLSKIIAELGRAGSSNNSAVCNARIFFARNPILRRSPYAGMLFNGAGRPLRSNGFASTLPASMGGNKTPIVDEAEIFEKEASFIERYHAELVAGRAVREGEAPNRLRRLTLDECKLIQSFPDNYSFSGRQSSVYRQIGNAVPSRLAFAVTQSVDDIIGNRETSKAIISSRDKGSFVRNTALM